MRIVAAQRRPARPGRQLSATVSVTVERFTAQRRPARPGRQLTVTVGHAGSHARSRAQRRPARPGRQLHGVDARRRRPDRRSTKAGPAGPATPGASWPVRTSAEPLNEGRPGRAGKLVAYRQASRSPDSTTYFAQRRPARPGRQLHLTRADKRQRAAELRSTKAGPAGPATPLGPS